MVSASATIPLSTLLRQYQLGLVQISGFTPSEDEDAQVQWVHGTDLDDPTPFLTPRTVLLTTGAQFTGKKNTAEVQRRYVSSLIDAGVCALGFAINFGHEKIPEALIQACEEQKLPLFRVPYSTPFIAISQTAARLINDQSRARDVWSIAAQRSVALAALQHAGLSAVIKELSKQIGAQVALFDAVGTLVTSPSPGSRMNDLIDDIHGDVLAMLNNQMRASRSSVHEGQRFTMQTLGRRGQLLGVLAIHDTGNLDYAAQSVISIVVALGSITLEQQATLSAPLEQIRAVILDLLDAGDVTLAKKIARKSFGELPSVPIICASIDRSACTQTNLVARLQQRSELDASALFTAIFEDELVLVFSERTAHHVYEAIAESHSSAGISLVITYESFAEGREQARLARAQTTSTEDSNIVHFSHGKHAGVFALLEHNEAAVRRAQTLLSPILASDERHDETLCHTLATWLGQHGQYVPAAAELGIHRHTLKSHIARAGQLLGKDLNSVSVRVDLWAALTLLGRKTDS